MEELYWVTTLGNISVLCCIISTVGLMFALIFTTLFMCADYYDNDSSQKQKALHKKSLIWLWVISVIMLFGAVFIPSKQDLYVIYGVGSTIDYLKENPTAQGLPDKYIKLLDKIADEQLEDTKK